MNVLVALVLIIGGIAVLLPAHQSHAFEPFQPLPARPPIPADNPLSEAKIALGKALFFDKRLSVNQTLSCNNCHDLMAGGADRSALSTGALGKPGHRSAPTLWNVAYETVYFWDGRAASLEEAIKEQLLSPTEMAMPAETSVIERLGKIPGYRQQFSAAFNGDDTPTFDQLAQALASYIRTLVTVNSPFDRYLKGNKSAISTQAQRGFRQFIDTGCASCHFWVNLAGPVPGLAFPMGEGFYELFPNHVGSDYDKQYHLVDDLGRYHVTGLDNHKRMWRVPTLRNSAITAPYLHNGQVKTLDEAVRVMAVTQLKQQLTTQQVSDIVSFLQTLTGEFPEQTMPRLPERPPG